MSELVHVEVDDLSVRHRPDDIAAPEPADLADEAYRDALEEAGPEPDAGRG